jgi:general secretion pathway protein H
MVSKAAQAMMQTLVLGRIKPQQKGFTLIEVMITLLVIGIMMAGVGLATGGFRQRDLEFEAERLAQLFSLAREEAQVRGRPVRLVTDEIGFQFESFSENQWRLIRDDALLRQRKWEQTTQVKIETLDKSEGSIEFGREQIDAPFTIRLTRDLAVVTVTSDGMGRFQVAKSSVAPPQ